MKRYLLLLTCLISLAAMAQGIYNVRDYGAKGDGKTLDSPAINSAIEACVAGGGGQVLLPAGTRSTARLSTMPSRPVSLVAADKCCCLPEPI